MSAILRSPPLPVLFLSHGGGPAHLLDSRGSFASAMDKNSPSADFLRHLPQIIHHYSTPPPQSPVTATNTNTIRCILVISAHWEEREFTVDYQLPNNNNNANTNAVASSTCKLVFDYYGFPKEAYPPYFTYPVTTDLTIAERVFSLLQEAKIPCREADRGFDHGTFIPLKVAFPSAEIPVVQLSLKHTLNIAEHIHLGEVLRPLREEGVLIIGSGQITHNLQALRSSSSNSNKNDPRCLEFTTWMKTLIESTTKENYEENKRILSNAEELAPYFAFAHPRTEHFIPMAVAYGAGLGGEGSEGKRIYDEIIMGNMGIDSYIFYEKTVLSSENSP